MSKYDFEHMRHLDVPISPPGRARQVYWRMVSAIGPIGLAWVAGMETGACRLSFFVSALFVALAAAAVWLIMWRSL